MPLPPCLSPLRAIRDPKSRCAELFLVPHLNFTDLAVSGAARVPPAAARRSARDRVIRCANPESEEILKIQNFYMIQRRTRARNHTEAGPGDGEQGPGGNLGRR